MSPVAWRAPTLHCEARPFGATNTVAPAARAQATVSSALPPSTTITSHAHPDVDAHARALSTARRTLSASFNVGTTTEIRGRWTFGGIGIARRVGDVARVAAGGSRAAVAIATPIAGNTRVRATKAREHARLRAARLSSESQGRGRGSMLPEMTRPKIPRASVTSCRRLQGNESSERAARDGAVDVRSAVVA
jgi:hypothetical protein